MSRAMKRVKIIESDQHAPHRRPEEIAELLGKGGYLTGRAMGDLVEVRMSIDGKKPFGYLFHRSEVEGL